MEPAKKFKPRIVKSNKCPICREESNENAHEMCARLSCMPALPESVKVEENVEDGYVLCVIITDKDGMYPLLYRSAEGLAAGLARNWWPEWVEMWSDYEEDLVEGLPSPPTEDEIHDKIDESMYIVLNGEERLLKYPQQVVLFEYLDVKITMQMKKIME
jgi:hypothetical protein